METYAFPVIGHKMVDKITRSDVLAVLKPIWTEKNETATRVRQRMETVMDWAIAEGYRPLEDNPADRALLKVLPKVRREEKHYQALPYDQVGWAIRLVQDSTANLLKQAGLRVPGADRGSFSCGAKCQLGRNTLA